jgi:hypothetical protein
MCVCVCHGFYYDWVEKRHPRGINNDRMVLPGLSDSLLPYSPPQNHDVCASTRLQTLVFPPGLGTSKGVAVH